MSGGLFFDRRCRVAALLPALLLAPLGVALCQEPEALTGFAVTTRNYDNQRTGANTAEKTLNAGNVKFSSFGKLFQVSVDDQVYAGILYASGLSIAGGSHNVFFVETVNNTVYAFDADRAGSPLWQRNFNNGGRPTNNTEVGSKCGTFRDFRGHIGIVGTPVIDPNTMALYFVTRTVDSDGTTRQRLQAINIADGTDRPNSPHVIGTINAVTNNQRPGLALSQGVVIVAWSSYCDTPPYNGRVSAFDATTLAQLGSFNATATGSLAGIWMAGAAPAFDSSGNLYLTTGNGTWDGTNNFGETVLKLDPPSLSRLDWFTPSNVSSLNSGDLDLGSAGPILVPGNNLLVQGGKQGRAYLLDINNMGHMVSGDTQIQQSWQAVDTTVRPSNTHHLHNTMIAWNSPQGLNLYSWGENDFARAWRFNTGTHKFNTPAFAAGSILPPIGMPGGMMTLSANGSAAGSGVLWGASPFSGDANHNTVPGRLDAFNAETMALLYSSTMNSADNANTFAKGAPPLVANGKVYLASLSNSVSVYGLTSTFEAEALPVAAFSSGRSLHNTSGTPYSGGQGMILEGHAVGDFAAFTVNVPQARSYNVRTRVKKLNNRAIWQLSVDGVNLGGTVDGFSATQQWVEIPIGNMTFKTAGNHTFRFTVTGKNANSSDFWIALDYVKLAPR